MEKINIFFKKYSITILILLITISGFLLRLNTGVKILTIDEIATLRAASQTFPSGILNSLINKNLHLPLYYFIFHFWIKLFGTSFFIIRLLPVLIGTLCIPVSYFCAKELFKTTRFKIATVILVAVNPVLILLSNYCKFYSLLSLLSFLSMLFLIRVKRNPKITNIILLALTNSLIIDTFVLGFLFVLIQFTLFIAYLFFKKNKLSSNITIKYPLILLLFIVPIIPILIKVIINTQNGLIPHLWWYKFNPDDIFKVIYSWFTPDLIALLKIEHLTELKQLLYLDNGSIYLLELNIISFLIFIIGIFKTATKKHFTSIFLYISLLFIFVEFIAALFGKFAFITRYTAIALPGILIAVAYGLSIIKNSEISICLIFILCLSNFFSKGLEIENVYHILDYNFSSIANALNEYKITKNDFIIMPIRGDYLELYYDTHKTNFISFDINYAYKSNDTKVLKNILDLKYTKHTNMSPHERFNGYLRTNKESKELKKYLYQECFNKLNKDSKVFLILPTFGIDFSQINKIIRDETIYNQLEIFNLLITKLDYDLIQIMNKNPILKKVKTKYTNVFIILIYEKQTAAD